jgi:hypothetical protein
MVEFTKDVSPYVLLIGGAIISSLLIPDFTRKWQDHQKELEIKTDLADLINKAISNIVVAAHLNLNPSYSANNSARFTNAYTDWITSKAVIHSKIQIYFNDTQITKYWDNLSNATTQITGIAASPPVSTKNTTPRAYNVAWCNRLGEIMIMHASYTQNSPINIDRNELYFYHCNEFYIPGLEGTQQLQKYFPVKNGGIDWNALFHRDNNTTSNLNNFGRSYSILEKYIENHKNNLLESIFKGQIGAFK